MDKHYVVALEWAEGRLYENGTNIIAVTHTFDEASAELVKAATEERELAKKLGWRIISDNGYEFNAGSDEEYYMHHSRLFITEV